MQPLVDPMLEQQSLLAGMLYEEPSSEALIACEVNVGTPLEPEWEGRTYHAQRREKTGDWSVLVGEGMAFEVFANWSRIIGWLARLEPRSVEFLVQ